jgi:hypothetical protein
MQVATPLILVLGRMQMSGKDKRKALLFTNPASQARANVDIRLRFDNYGLFTSPRVNNENFFA